MPASTTDLGTVESPTGASVNMALHGSALPGEFGIVDLTFFANAPASIEVVAGGTTLQPMGQWSREPDISIHRFGARLPNGVSGTIIITIDTPADPFIGLAYSLHGSGSLENQVVIPVGPAKQSSGVQNPIVLDPQWTTPAGTDIVITTLGLKDYSAGVWNGMTETINIVNRMYAGHSTQTGSFDVGMNNASPTTGNAVWLMAVSALSVLEVAPVRIRGQTAWETITPPDAPARIRGTDGQWHDLTTTIARIRGTDGWHSLNSAE